MVGVSPIPHLEREGPGNEVAYVLGITLACNDFSRLDRLRTITTNEKADLEASV